MTDYEIFNYQINPSWKEYLEPLFKSENFKKTIQEVKRTSEFHNLPVYPKTENVFRVFKEDFNQVKILILSQDPYHTPHVAHGLSFSSNKPNYLPPSLDNIFKEIESDLGSSNRNVNLERWSNQGVFLLNTSLTVLKSSPGIHLKHWEWFTTGVIQLLNANKSNLVFMLWGAKAKQYKKFIDSEKHLVLEAAHPSPFSAHNGFFGCKHFSKCNNYLISKGISPIDWNKN